jgi:DNA end-binding protein Ku
MASRPVWQGHLRLSLVNCPVALHKATAEARDIRFHLLNPETHNRVKQAWRDSVTGDELARRDLVRGFEVAKDEYVVMEDDELKALKLESTKVIDIERFVDAGGIDRLYWDQPYFLVPDGKPAAEPFAVIREAMAGQDKVALGRLVMASRERIVAVEVRNSGMLLTTLRSRDEVRAEEDVFEDIPEVKVDARMIDIAQRIIAQSEGAFDPSEFRDRYEEALRELVAKKAGGAKPARSRPAPAEESNVIDLMDALRRSLKAPPAPRGTAAHRAEARPKKPAPRAAGKVRRQADDAPPPTAAAATAHARRGGAKHGRAAGGRATA